MGFNLINCFPMHSLNQITFICLSPLYGRVRKQILVPCELKNKHGVRSFFWVNKSILRAKSKDLSCIGASSFSKNLIIRQIRYYLLDKIQQISRYLQE